MSVVLKLIPPNYGLYNHKVTNIPKCVDSRNINEAGGPCLLPLSLRKCNNIIKGVVVGIL